MQKSVRVLVLHVYKSSSLGSEATQWSKANLRNQNGRILILTCALQAILLQVNFWNTLPDFLAHACQPFWESLTNFVAVMKHYFIIKFSKINPGRKRHMFLYNFKIRLQHYNLPWAPGFNIPKQFYWASPVEAGELFFCFTNVYRHVRHCQFFSDQNFMALFMLMGW